MRRVFLPERWEQIIEIIEQQDGATVEEISRVLGISSATVRRDLARIDQRGLIKRTRGGAAPSPQVRVGPTLAESLKINPREKEAIGRVAAELVRDGDTIAIDGGFTTYQVARQVTARYITVITNSLDVAQAMTSRNDVKIILLGGELNIGTGTTVGPLTEANIRHFWADKAILGADAISPEEGLSSSISPTAQTKKAMIECSRELIIVADYTKLGKFALYKVVPTDAVSTLITDDKADSSVIEGFRAAGVEVVVAGNG